MKKLLLTKILLLSILFTCTGQTIVNQSSANSYLNYLGGIGPQLVFKVPIRDGSPVYPNVPYIGRIEFKNTDSTLSYHNGVSWQKIMTSKMSADSMIMIKKKMDTIKQEVNLKIPISRILNIDGDVNDLSVNRTYNTKPDWLNIKNKPNIPTNTNQLINGANFIDVASASLTFQPLLGYIPIPNTRTINGKVLSNNISINKADVGLGNLDNTSDINKPISTLTQIALDNLSSSLSNKQDALVSGNNIKSINGNSILGSGNISLATGGVTSVGILSNDFDINGSPITSSGNITVNLKPSGVVAGNYGAVNVDTKGRVLSGKRLEFYSGTTSGTSGGVALGQYTITYSTPYSLLPNVQPVIRNQSNPQQFCALTNSTTTGFTITVYQRNTVNLLSTELLLGATVPTNNISVDVMVTEK